MYVHTRKLHFSGKIKVKIKYMYYLVETPDSCELYKPFNCHTFSIKMETFQGLRLAIKHLVYFIITNIRSFWKAFFAPRQAGFEPTNPLH